MKQFLAIALLTFASTQLSAAPEKSVDQTISVDFEDVEARKLLTDVAALFHTRVTIPAEFRGTTNIKLRDVTLTQIFAVTLQPLGYDFIERDDYVQVLRTDECRNLPHETEHLPVYFQKSDELAEFLTKHFRGELTARGNGDAVSITVHPKYLRRVRSMIARVDSPDFRLNRFPRKPFFPDRLPDHLLSEHGQGLGESGPSYPVSTEVILLDWVSADLVKQAIEREKLGAITITPDPFSNALIVTGGQTVRRKVAAITEYLDDKRWYKAPAEISSGPTSGL